MIVIINYYILTEPIVMGGDIIVELILVALMLLFIILVYWDLLQMAWDVLFWVVTYVWLFCLLVCFI